jgi:carbonic anhydrase/acetyltransferase-like protein (isoleucine patch superfamily)
VGAGALVTENKVFADGELILGAPARAMGAVSAQQREHLHRSAQVYVANARRYAQGLERGD